MPNIIGYARQLMTREPQPCPHPPLSNCIHYLISQGEFRVSAYNGLGDERKIYAKLTLASEGMKLEIETETIPYYEGAYEQVITDLYNKVKTARSKYSH